MPIDSEIQERKWGLDRELDLSIKDAELKGRLNHLTSLGLMASALGCSLLAAILGIFSSIDAKIIGGLAVLPPVIAYIAVNLKLEEKCGWHYRKGIGLRTLRSRLLYQQPEVPSVSNIAAIARERDGLDFDMQLEWESDLKLNWSGMMSGPRHRSNEFSEAPTLARQDRAKGLSSHHKGHRDSQPQD